MASYDTGSHLNYDLGRRKEILDLLDMYQKQGMSDQAAANQLSMMTKQRQWQKEDEYSNQVQSKKDREQAREDMIADELRKAQAAAKLENDKRVQEEQDLQRALKTQYETARAAGMRNYGLAQEAVVIDPQTGRLVPAVAGRQKFNPSEWTGGGGGAAPGAGGSFGSTIPGEDTGSYSTREADASKAYNERRAQEAGTALSNAQAENFRQAPDLAREQMGLKKSQAQESAGLEALIAAQKMQREQEKSAYAAQKQQATTISKANDYISKQRDKLQYDDALEDDRVIKNIARAKADLFGANYPDILAAERRLYDQEKAQYAIQGKQPRKRMGL